MIYTGVGSRKAPQDILDLFERVGELMAVQGHILRSGGAAGCDSAFERGCDKVNGQKEIYHPRDANAAAEEVVRTVINNVHWARLTPYARLLHTRNVFQVLGKDLDKPSGIVLCWTPLGGISGGTATAIKLAMNYSIQVVNAGSTRGRERLEKYIS